MRRGRSAQTYMHSNRGIYAGEDTSTGYFGVRELGIRLAVEAWGKMTRARKLLSLEE